MLLTRDTAIAKEARATALVVMPNLSTLIVSGSLLLMAEREDLEEKSQTLYSRATRVLLALWRYMLDTMMALQIDTTVFISSSLLISTLKTRTGTVSSNPGSIS